MYEVIFRVNFSSSSWKKLSCEGHPNISGKKYIIICFSACFSSTHLPALLGALFPFWPWYHYFLWDSLLGEKKVSPYISSEMMWAPSQSSPFISWKLEELLFHMRVTHGPEEMKSMQRQWASERTFELHEKRGSTNMRIIFICIILFRAAIKCFQY